MGTKTREDIDKIPIKNRTRQQHQWMIKNKFDGDVREYLLSMGAFNDVPFDEYLVYLNNNGTIEFEKVFSTEKQCEDYIEEMNIKVDCSINPKIFWVIKERS